MTTEVVHLKDELQGCAVAVVDGLSFIAKEEGSIMLGALPAGVDLQSQGYSSARMSLG